MTNNSHYQESGIRGWSVGPLCHWTVRGVGIRWQAFNCVTGQAGTLFPRGETTEASYLAQDSAEFEILFLLSTAVPASCEHCEVAEYNLRR